MHFSLSLSRSPSPSISLNVDLCLSRLILSRSDSTKQINPTWADARAALNVIFTSQQVIEKQPRPLGPTETVCLFKKRNTKMTTTNSGKQASGVSSHGYAGVGGGESSEVTLPSVPDDFGVHSASVSPSRCHSVFETGRGPG